MHAIFLSDETATDAFGRALADVLVPGLVIYLEGSLGAGKTALCRGVLRGLGHEAAVKSPTYTLVEPYDLVGEAKHSDLSVRVKRMYHFDLYRLADPEELEFLGIRDYFDGEAVSFVEWPSKGLGLLPKADCLIELLPSGEGRQLVFRSESSLGAKLGSDLMGRLDAFCALSKDLSSGAP